LIILPEKNHEYLRDLEGGYLHWLIMKAYIDNRFRGKSREYQALRGRLPSLAFEENLYR
jgi:hypothetical protein